MRDGTVAQALRARDPPWSRPDGVVLAAAGAVLLLRWPDRARWLHSWDSNTFALALERYDVFALRPHAPGYPVYVALARAVHAVVPSANDALIALGLAFTFAGVVALYALGRALAGRGAGITALGLLLASPVLYVHNATANAYAAEMACSLLVAWAAWRAHHDPSPHRLALLAFALAAAVGVRPSLAIYLLPLTAWAALHPPWGMRHQARRLAVPLAVGGAAALAWFVPMVEGSGGLAAWRQANRMQSEEVVFAETAFTDGWGAFAANVDRLALFLRWELRWVLPVVMLLLVAFLLAGPRSRAWRPAWSGPTAFLAVWLAPPLLFFALVYSGYNEGPSGYILAVLPGLLLAACAAVAWASSRVAWKPVVVGAVTFLAFATSVVGLAGHRHDVADVGYREHDAWADAWSRLGETFPPTNSTIVASWHFAHVWYNFPDHVSYNYRRMGEGPEQGTGLFIQRAHQREAVPDWYTHDNPRPGVRHPLPEGTRHLVLFDFQLAGENGGPREVRDDVPVREAFLPNGWRVLVVDAMPDRPDLEDYFRGPEAVA